MRDPLKLPTIARLSSQIPASSVPGILRRPYGSRSGKLRLPERLRDLRKYHAHGTGEVRLLNPRDRFQNTLGSGLGHAFTAKTPMVPYTRRRLGMPRLRMAALPAKPRLPLLAEEH